VAEVLQTEVMAAIPTIARVVGVANRRLVRDLTDGVNAIRLPVTAVEVEEKVQEWRSALLQVVVI
jgi:hypothetical protein